MKKIFLTFSLCFILGFSATVIAEETKHGTDKEAEAMVDKALQYFKKNGKDKAFAAFTDREGEFVDRDLYIFVVNHDGLTLAHGGNSKLVGNNMIGLQDADGKFFIQKMIESAKKGGGWVDYKWTNPETKRIQDKSTLIKPLPGIDAFLGCGIYK